MGRLGGVDAPQQHGGHDDRVSDDVSCSVRNQTQAIQKAERLNGRAAQRGLIGF
jgi:hypothetical protein